MLVCIGTLDTRIGYCCKKDFIPLFGSIELRIGSHASRVDTSYCSIKIVISLFNSVLWRLENMVESKKLR